MEHRNGPATGTADHDDGPPDDDSPPWEEEGPHGDTTPRTSWRSLPMWTAVILVVLALGGGYLLGRPSYPLDTSADAGFLRDMSAHHAQAVDMSMIILEKTEDPELSTVATDIARTQQSQIGIMQGWLMAWDLPARGSQPAMAWMEGHDHGGGEGGEVPDTMPGLASSEEMASLEEAEGEEAELLFLELMIAHHEGGIDMADAEVELGQEELVVNFAEGMASSQQKEIELMEGMIDQRVDGASGD
ncbi:DUF305 domain-containing protein [Nocardiopsis halotolerans]|uniref:DUF305 domain-containing protein n=1 Tax=Nocardiopsis halotolerans TaxID=124252 RepID=UPI00034BD86D|nr:DUF305 domain-containing protein [Nocardiopsis halotolerans]